jgi:hypothetical protein
MFAHAGFRPLWPVIVFVPWIFLGFAFLMRALRNLPISAARGRASTLRREGREE